MMKACLTAWATEVILVYLILQFKTEKKNKKITYKSQIN